MAGDAVRVEEALQRLVERVGPEAAAVHRAEHLDVAHRIETEALRDAFGHHLQQLLQCAIGILGVHEEAIALTRLAERRHLAGIDRVRRHHDAALGRLAVNFSQARHGHAARVDDVGQHLPGADRRQLVDVSHEQQAHRIGHRLQQVRHQHDIDHRRLVDHQQVALERMAGTTAEAPVLRVDLEKAMDGLCLEARRLGHALGGPARGRGKQGTDALGHEDAEDGSQHRGLADTRATGQHHHPRVEGTGDGHPLTRGECQRQLAFDPRDRAFGVDGRPRTGAADQAREPRRHRVLGGVE